jgi:hypothetical protein
MTKTKCYKENKKIFTIYIKTITMSKFNLKNFFSSTAGKFGTKNNPRAQQLKSGTAPTQKRLFGLDKTNINKVFKKYMVLTEGTVNDLAGKTGNLSGWTTQNMSAATYPTITSLEAATQKKYIKPGKSNQG